MDHLQAMRPSDFGFLCCGRGLLVATAFAGQLPRVGIALPFIGMGMMFVAGGRRAG